MTREITFPLTIQGIEFSDTPPIKERLLFGGKCGNFVAVRPCGEKFGGKTFLGILIGEIPLHQGVRFNERTGILMVEQGLYNPLIFIPEHATTVLGCASWWGAIKDETHLRQITDADIENVWYVRALKQLAETTAAPSSS